MLAGEFSCFGQSWINSCRHSSAINSQWQSKNMEMVHSCQIPFGSTFTSVFIYRHPPVSKPFVFTQWSSWISVVCWLLHVPTTFKCISGMDLLRILYMLPHWGRSRGSDLPPHSLFVCWLVGCFTSQQHASVSQWRICSDNFTCCHTEIEVADPTFYLTQSQYTDTRPTSPSADPITPGAWQGIHWNANFWVTGMTRPRKNPGASRIRTRDLSLSRRTPYH